MEQWDVTELRVADGTLPLCLASRPGYQFSPGSDRDSCRRFASDMRADGIGLAVVLLTPPEIRVFFDFDLCALYGASGVEPLHYPIEDSLVPDESGSKLARRLEFSSGSGNAFP